MHVCLLNATNVFGGVELHTLRLSRFLLDRGHKITLALLGLDVFNGRWGGLEGSLDVLRLPQQNPSATISFRQARRLTAQLPGEVCILEKGCIDLGSVGLDLAARLRFKRYFTIEQLEAEPMPPITSRRHLRGLVPGVGLWWYKLKLRRRLRALWPQRIVCVSQSVHKRLVRDYRFPERKMVVAANGVDTDQFQRDDGARERIRQRWAVKPTTLVFGTMGRFAEVKRLEVAIRCFARLRNTAQAGEMQLVLVGEGPKESVLRALVGELGLDDLVRFLPFTDRPCETLNGFDVFLMPSANEGLPFALLEAMACGCCPIATDVGGNREVVASNCGWLVPACDEDAFYEGMCQAATLTIEERNAIGKAARERVVANFDQGQQMRLIAAALES